MCTRSCALLRMEEQYRSLAGFKCCILMHASYSQRAVIERREGLATRGARRVRRTSPTGQGGGGGLLFRWRGM